MDKSRKFPLVLYTITRRLRPDLPQLSEQEQAARLPDILGLLVILPFTAAGLIWVVFATRLDLQPGQWLLLAVIAILEFIFGKLTFFFIADIRAEIGGGHGNVTGSLDGVIKWSGLFLIGPVVLWVDILQAMLSFWGSWRSTQSRDVRWNLGRNFAYSLAVTCLTPIPGLLVFNWLGRGIPVQIVSPLVLLAGVLAVLASMAAEVFLLFSAYLGVTMWVLGGQLSAQGRKQMLRITLAGLVIGYAPSVFAILLACLYVQNGLIFYAFFAAGILLVALMAGQFSKAVEASRQQSVQIKKLEEMGRAILRSAPDSSELPSVLEKYVPEMFMASKIAIWVQPDRTLLDWGNHTTASDFASARQWIMSQLPEARAFQTGEALPWLSAQASSPANHGVVLVAPVLDGESGEATGGIYLELQKIAAAYNPDTLARMAPTVQSLAAQVASALHQAKMYALALAHQKTQQELALARRIQTSFLPREIPEAAGWQIAASLQPAREMAGDFYDLLPLPAGKLGLLIGDVADKGVGPALYMALTRTLVRSFAAQFNDQPAAVLGAVNARILEDAGETLFVTVFYGVLDLASGRLIYANAGHNPPWIFTPGQAEVRCLAHTGIPLGIEEEMEWEQTETGVGSGSTLMLYTDGAADVPNLQEEYFGDERLKEAAAQALELPAEQMMASIFEKIHAFKGDAPQFDDITLMLLRKE